MMPTHPNTMNILEELRKPFEPKHISWKPGATKGDKCLALAYADLRAYMERLDGVCGLDWSVFYEPWGDNRIIARLTIGSATRSSTGEMDAQDEKNNMGGTVAEAQAFKRAAVMFGLGRFLYDLPSVWVATDGKRITDGGLKDLDNRYQAWYVKQMTARAAYKPVAPISAPVAHIDQDTGEIIDAADIFTKDEPLTDEEHDIITIWQTWRDAKEYAVAVGACENVHEAENSIKKAARDAGLTITQDNKKDGFLVALRHWNKKLAQQPATA